MWSLKRRLFPDNEQTLWHRIHKWLHLCKWREWNEAAKSLRSKFLLQVRERGADNPLCSRHYQLEVRSFLSSAEYHTVQQDVRTLSGVLDYKFFEELLEEVQLSQCLEEKVLPSLFFFLPALFVPQVRISDICTPGSLTVTFYQRPVFQQSADPQKVPALWKSSVILLALNKIQPNWRQWF